MRVKRLLTVAFAVMIAVTMLAVPVFAVPGEATSEQQTTAPFVKKTLKGNEGVSLTHDFTFTFTAVGKNGNSIATVDADSHPTINSVTISVTKPNSSNASVSNTAAIDLSVFDNCSPGIYAYTVTEDTFEGYDDYTSENGKINFDATTYTMFVYIVNNADGTGVEVRAVTAVKNNSDGTLSDEKVNWNNGMEFTNEIIKKGNPGTDTTDLTITKTVTGTLGDKNKDFTFTVTFSEDDTVALPEGWELTSITGKKGTTALTNTSGTFTFTLKNGESAEFVNVPAGVKYSIKEEAADNYTATFQNKHGTTTSTSVSGTKSAGFTDETKYVIYEDGGNTGVMTNNNDDITITGILTENAPYILLIAFGIAAAALYIRMKRKAAR